MIEPMAESLRSHPNIHGFHLAGNSYNVHLFADDVILMLTKPEVSLIHAHDVLSKFSTLSYYKVNSVNL